MTFDWCGGSTRRRAYGDTTPAELTTEESERLARYKAIYAVQSRGFGYDEARRLYAWRGWLRWLHPTADRS